MKKTKECKIIMPTNPTWIELKQEGDFNCPDCGELMVMIVSGFYISYAYCLKCCKYWTTEGNA